MENGVKTQKEIEQERLELNEQFDTFLHTRGIKAKFKLAFDNMAESAHSQHEADRANFEAVKAQSAEENKEFVEFLHTKGLKAKWNLVIENIKKSAAAAPAPAPANTAAQIAKVQAETQANIAKANTYGTAGYTAESLTDEFQAFLKSKGLDGKYSVVISEEK